jgi:hypothetical protein
MLDLAGGPFLHHRHVALGWTDVKGRSSGLPPCEAKPHGEWDQP